MRKAFDSCLATFFGYAAFKAFGHEDYAGVYFSGLAAAFASADLVKACRGDKAFVNQNDFSTPSIAFITVATAGVSLYSLSVGSTVLKDPVDVVLRGVGNLAASIGGIKLLKDRLTKSPDMSQQDSVPRISEP